MKQLILLFLLIICYCSGQTPAPTPNVTVPGIATLRPTSPTMPPIMLPDSDSDDPENKSEEIPIVAVYFIMFGVTCMFTFVGICLNIYGVIGPEKRNKIEQW
jgi:hypothetical protein